MRNSGGGVDTQSPELRLSYFAVEAELAGLLAESEDLLALDAFSLAGLASFAGGASFVSDAVEDLEVDRESLR